MEKLYTLRRTLSAAVLLMMSTIAWAYEYFEVNGIYYGLDESKGSVSVASNVNGYSGDIVIPSTVSVNDRTYKVTGIEQSAFYNCHSLTSITIPDNVTSIGSDAFSGCSGLISVTIPSGVTSIERSVFSECSGLTSITLPPNVTSIGDDAFSGCSSLTSISIPKSVTSIGNAAFYGCSSITSISIPEGVTDIDRYVFCGCSSLTSISIPDGVTGIGSYAFRGCTSLTSISIPEGVTSIGHAAFYLCSSLTSVTCHAKHLPELGLYVFTQVPTNRATLYVPASALADYKAADYWKDFGTILPLEDIPAGISNVKADATNTPYYTLDGIRVDNPTQKGIYIKNGKKVFVK